MTTPGQPSPPTWLHLGDLHPKEPGGENRHGLDRIVALAPALLPGDRDAIDAWPEKGIVGGQLGHNRDGRKW